MRKLELLKRFAVEARRSVAVDPRASPDVHQTVADPTLLNGQIVRVDVVSLCSIRSYATDHDPVFCESLGFRDDELALRQLTGDLAEAPQRSASFVGQPSRAVIGRGLVPHDQVAVRVTAILGQPHVQLAGINVRTSILEHGRHAGHGTARRTDRAGAGPQLLSAPSRVPLTEERNRIDRR